MRIRVPSGSLMILMLLSGLIVRLFMISCSFSFAVWKLFVPSVLTRLELDPPPVSVRMTKPDPGAGALLDSWPD